MGRRRSTAQRAPQTKEQAIEALGRYAELDAAIAARNALREHEVAQANTSADQDVLPFEAEQKDLHKQLAAWWAVSHEDMTGGKSRSIELGSCAIGFRLTPPKLVHGYAKDGEAAIALRATAYGDDLTKVSYTLDKPAILRRVDEETGVKALKAAGAEGLIDLPEKDLDALGFKPKQTDEFFIAPIAPAQPASVSTEIG